MLEVVKDDLICDGLAIVVCPVKKKMIMIVQKFVSASEEKQGTLFQLDSRLLSL